MAGPRRIGHSGSRGLFFQYTGPVLAADYGFLVVGVKSNVVFQSVLPFSVSTRKKSEDLGEGDARQLFSESQSSEFIEVLRLVLKRYRAGWPTIRQMADLANVSVRTLQRRLATEGQTYARMVDQARVELAVELLRDTESTHVEIAAELGYSEPNNFARAFKRWTGKTPEQYRIDEQK
jgi:AraC-like DNA-binding protein